MKIEKKNIKKWVKALRSGNYQQTTGCLNDSTGFCCLGVAMKEFAPNAELRVDDGKNSGCIYGEHPTDNRASPAWLKTINDDFEDRVSIDDTWGSASLAELNDDHNLSFDEIADCLEAVYIHEVLS